jgi:hypothetical protein
MVTVVPDLLDAAREALYDVPGVRSVLGLASPEWRPLWALTWFVALVYAALRVVAVAQRARLFSRLRSQLPDTRVAAAAPSVRPATSSREPGEDVAPGATLDAAAHDAPVQPAVVVAVAAPVARTRGVAAYGALAAAVAGTLVIVGRGGRDASARQGDDPTMPAFTFAARGWRTAAGACVATVEATGDTRPADSLTMWVLDVRGEVLGRATVRPGVITRGAFHEFRFPGVDCDAVTRWQVQG